MRLSSNFKQTTAKIHETGKSSLYTVVALIVILLVSANTLSAVLHWIWNDVGNNWLYTYRYLLDHGVSGLQLGILGHCILHLLTYWPLALAYWYCDIYRPTWLFRFKIQPKVQVTSAEYRRIYKQVLFNQFMVSFPTVAVHHFLMEWRTGGTYTLAETWPSFWQFVLHIVVILLVEELLFYYSHRAAHHPWLYKAVHKKHHEFTAPVAMAAIYCTSIEHLMCNLVPVHAGVLLCGSHWSICAVWYVIAVANTVNTHSGYHLPFAPSPESHDFHHKNFTQNFGALGILDWLHGTDTVFRASEEFKKHVVYFAPPEPVVDGGKKAAWKWDANDSECEREGKTISM